MSIKLIVTKRANDIHVAPEGQSDVWECGKTVAEAIGKWVITHGHIYGPEIVWSDGKTVDTSFGELSEDELFAFANERTGRPMTENEREWCLDQITQAEGHEREHYVGCSNKQLARSVLTAWVDIARDKGTL